MKKMEMLIRIFIFFYTSTRRKQSFDSIGSSEGPTELLRTRTLDFVHLKFNLEAGSLLPLALKGRLRHGRHFTFMSALNDTAVTLVSTSVNGSIADENHPFAAHGPWLQVGVNNHVLKIDLTQQLHFPSFDFQTFKELLFYSNVFCLLELVMVQIFRTRMTWV